MSERGFGEGECLKFPGYKCRCWMKDEELRAEMLNNLKHRYGVDSPLNLNKHDVSEQYNTGKRRLCEGMPPPVTQQIMDSAKLFLRRFKRQLFT